MIRGYEDEMFPDGMDRPPWCLPPQEADTWKYEDGTSRPEWLSVPPREGDTGKYRDSDSGRETGD